MAFTPTSWTNGSGAAINATNLNNISNALAQNVEYQLATVVGQEIRIIRYSPSDIFKFRLATAVTGGAITISTDGGATSIALKNGAGDAVTELNAGLVEVAYVTPFFILRSSGGLDSFFGDGSDGTIPNLNTVTTAPNGGTVSNLWDMNAGTVFTTGTLSSASDQVVFSIDFEKPILILNTAPFILYSTNISAGVDRTLAFEVSDDGSTWTQKATVSISTGATNRIPSGATSTSHRYWRAVLKAGGSNCTLTCQGVTLNYSSGFGDLQTNKVFRILEPSTLNGAAVVKQYTDFNLPLGYEITVQNPNQGLIIYSQNDITNAGVIDMSQKAGLAPNGNVIPMLITKTAYKTATTSSLLHFDNNITDAQGRTWTNNGTATFDATNKVFGTHAISFNGTSQWIDTPASDDFSFGSDDFTIEGRIRPTTVGTVKTIYSDHDGTLDGVWAYIGSDNKITFTIRDTTLSTVTVTSTTVVSVNTYYYFVVSRKDNIIYLLINGILESFVLGNGSTYKSLLKPTIGKRGAFATPAYFAGQIDEFRIIKGKAMYTANFTPPTSAYTYQATYIDTPKTLEKYFQLTNVLQTLRGGYGSNGGYGGGYSGSTGRQTSVGIGGAGRQNLGGFGGGGSGGLVTGTGVGGIGGSILNAEIGGGKLQRNISNASSSSLRGLNGVNGSGALGEGSALTVNNYVGATGYAYGGGSGGSGGALNSVNSNDTGDGQYSGGFLMLIAKNNITNSGTIRANGGTGSNGGAGSQANAGGGGGGGGAGGGVVALFHSGTYSNTGTVQVNGGAGGTGGAGVGTGEAGGTASSGSSGQILTQAL